MNVDSRQPALRSRAKPCAPRRTFVTVTVDRHTYGRPTRKPEAPEDQRRRVLFGGARRPGRGDRAQRPDLRLARRTASMRLATNGRKHRRQRLGARTELLPIGGSFALSNSCFGLLEPRRRLPRYPLTWRRACNKRIATITRTSGVHLACQIFAARIDL